MRPAWILVVGCLIPGRAGAESDAEKKFHEGKRLLKAGQLVEACAALAKSHDLAPKPGTLLNLGDCQQQRGQTATARDTFVQAKALAVQNGDKTRAVEADRRIAALEPVLARLTLVVPSEIVALGPSIHRNDVAVDAASWNKPVVTNPDTYTIRVRVRGYREWSIPYKLEPKLQGRVVVGPLVAETAAPAPLLTSTLAKHAEVRRFALGLLLGVNVQHESGVAGVRAVNAFDAPGGQIRANGNFYFSRYPDEPDDNPSYRTSTFSLGANIEYLWMPRPHFGLGGGLGIGAEYDAVNEKSTINPMDPRVNDLGFFFTVRASPMVLRLRETVEAGVHVGAVIAGDEITINAVVAVDWFVW